MKLIDAEELIEIFHNQYNMSRGEKREVYLDCAFLTDVHATEPIEAIPISWLTSKGMTMISNDARTELFKLIRAWREEQEERE